MIYGIDDKPGPFPLILYGLQWLAVSIPFAVIVGGIAARVHFAGDADLQTFYLQKMIFITGVTTVAQVAWGHKLPLIVGPADILLVGVLSSLTAGVPAIYTSILICGGIFILTAASGVLGRLRRLFTPRIIVTILFLIAFTLTPAINELIFGREGQPQFNLVFVLLLVLGMLIGNRLLPGIWKSMTVLLGMVTGSAAYFAVWGLPVPPETGAVFGFAGSGLFLPSFEFNPGTVLAFLICYIALFVNEIGSIEAAGQMFGVTDMEKRTGRAVGIFGVSNILSGLGGVLGSVDYTLSLGVVSATGCASRFTIIPAGIGLALFALCPHAIMLLTCVPGVVMAAVLLHLLTSIIASAFSMLTREGAISGFNSGLVIGLPLMLAIVVAFTPQESLAACPELLKPVAGNAFVLSTLFAMLLEHVVLRDKPGPG